MRNYKKYSLDLREMIILGAASLIVSLLCGWLFYNTFLGIVATPVILVLVKTPLEEYLMERRVRNLRNQFRDVLYSFSSSFAAGAHMEEAMEIAVVHINDIYGRESDMSKELMFMIKKMKDTAGSDTELWMNLAERSGVEDIEDFASVFAACRDAGGNLVQAVDRAAALIVEKINIENELRTLFSQKKTEGRMVGIMLVAMILFLRISSPSYLDLMYESALGRILMTGAATAMIYSIYLTEKITKVCI